MFLSEFLFDVEERYQDPLSDDSVELAKTAACCIVELIKRHFDVSEFFELIYTESCNFEFSQGLTIGRNEKEIPF